MRLVSTRNPNQIVTFTEAIQGNLAPDEGLYVPDAVPCFVDLTQLLAMDFQTRSSEILYRFLGDEFSREELALVVSEAFDFPAPLVRVRDRVFALELFHGPTLSFKDFGARFLARMLALIASKEGRRLRTILVAGSGDAGAAAASAFWRQAGFRTIILYPKGGIPELQERQIACPGDNVMSFAVEGSADDCRELARAAFSDPEALARQLVSADSSNIAFILAQLLFFFEASAQLRAMNLRDAPIFCVPCGNFGNLYAGLLALKTGLAVKAFVAATNLNGTVPEYLDTGEYRPRSSVTTLSSAMDVGAPVNWERIECLFPGDPSSLRSILRWGSVNDGDTRRALWELQGCGYRSEPHAAVAFALIQERLGLNETGVFLAPAHPSKYREVLVRDMNLEVPLLASQEALQAKPILSKPMSNSYPVLKSMILD